MRYVDRAKSHEVMIHLVLFKCVLFKASISKLARVRMVIIDQETDDFVELKLLSDKEQ